MARVPLTSAGYHIIDKFQDCAISLTVPYASVKDLCKLVMVHKSDVLLHNVKDKASGFCKN